MKAIVKTTGNFELHDLDAQQEVSNLKPSLVVVNAFINQRLGLGQIHVLVGDLPDEASSAEFDKFVAESDGNFDLAIQSFLSSLPQPEPGPDADAGEKVDQTLEDLKPAQQEAAADAGAVVKKDEPAADAPKV